MRKLLYFATALLVLASCSNKDNTLNNAPEGTPFKKGQQVTLTVGTGDNANQTAPRRVNGTDNGTQINFTWEAGDQILVRVGGETAVFELISGGGSAEGKFAGVMPADGSTFDVQYPTEVPDITKQVYSTENPIPANKMLFTATNCTLGNDAILDAQYAMLQLNLYGTDKTVGMIIFKNITADDAKPYTLTCTEGVEIGTSAASATPFYMVVPAGEYKFEMEVWNAAETPAMICSFATSEAKTFVAGECMNMQTKEVKNNYHNDYEYVDLGLPSGLKWATMNVGATSPLGYGDYFAWGETKPYYNTPITDPISWKSGRESGYSWQSYCGNSEFTEWSTVPYDENNVLKPEYDAAAANWGGAWRMPTKDEIAELTGYGYCTWTWILRDIFGYEVKGPNGNTIFLPAAGYRLDASLSNVGSYGYYWSSSLSEDYSSIAYGHDYSVNAYYLYFRPDNKDWFDHNRNYGQSVRPVCP